MTDHFYSSRERLAWAKDQAKELESSIKRFFDGQPYKTVNDRDASEQSNSLKLRLTAPIPQSFTRDIVQICEGLRAALDLAGAATFRGSGKKKTYFPFADSEANLQHTVAKNCRHLPAEIIALFCAFKPYKGTDGEGLLWALNELANSSKHRIVVPAIVGLHRMETTFSGSFNEGFRLNLPKWDAAKNQFVIAVVGTGDFNYDLKLSISVAIDKVEYVAGKPATAVLNTLASKVESIIDATEAEARRIGLIV